MIVAHPSNSAQGGAPTVMGGRWATRPRYYEPTLGRFTSQDPLGFAAGTNFYAYALNNPTNLTDPYGLETGDLNSMVPGPNGETATDAPLSPEQQRAMNANLFFPFYPMNWIPTHGNWCGPNWSGGINPTLYPGQPDGTAAPVDALDALCEKHDHIYEEIARCRASMDKTHQKQCEKMKIKADEDLANDAQHLPFDPSYDYADYRVALVTGFRVVILAEGGHIGD